MPSPAQPAAKSGKPRRAAPRGAARHPEPAALPQAHGAEQSAEERRRLIAIAAYHLAEKRGFAPGHESEDWLAAEAALDRP